MKPVIKPVHDVQVGDYVLVSPAPAKGKGKSFRARVEALKPLSVTYFRPKSATNKSAGWIENDIQHACEMGDLSRVIHGPVLLDPSRRHGPVRFPDLDPKQ